MKEQIKANYEAVLKRLAPYTKDRKITILGATKMQSIENINYLISLGVDTIGENRVNELLEKYEGYDKRASLHFIGTLQKNKVKYICDKVDLIHSVDSLALAQEIDKRCAKIGRVMDILIEVNSGREESKGGAMLEDVEALIEEVSALKCVRVRGLMTMAPRCSSREEYLSYFTPVKELFDRLFKNDNSAILSMGMSESYEYAAEAGANLVRIGSAIFGERKYL